MPDDELAEIERRLNAGEWLRPGEVAVLFDTSRMSIDRWMRAGRISYRRRGPRGDRLLSPVDVRRELAEYRRERHSGNGDHDGEAAAPERASEPAGE